MHIPTTNSDKDLSLPNINMHSLLSKLVNTLRLSHEHDLHFLTFRVGVDEVAEGFVDRVILPRNIPVVKTFNVVGELII